jgi:predicted transcriptional regulator
MYSWGRIRYPRNQVKGVEVAIKSTTFRLEDESLERLDKFAEHLRGSMNIPRATRSFAMEYLIRKAIASDGVPTWEATGSQEPRTIGEPTTLELGDDIEFP